MRLYLHSAYRQFFPQRPVGFLDTVRQLAELDKVGRHQLCEDPAEADAVFITEVQNHLDDWRFSRLRADPIVRRFAAKCYAYVDCDRPVCVLPGLYPSLTQSLGDPSQQESFCYLGIPAFDGDAVFQDTAPDLLFSFSGQLCNHACRRRMRLLKHPRAEIIDTSGIYIFEAAPDVAARLKERYRQQLARSKFVLCPRGGGSSSYRLFETMAAGRVPVVISDQWVEPKGPGWSDFSVRVAERDVPRIPALLEQIEPQYEQLSRRCREEFAKYYSRSRLFNTLGDAICRLSRSAEERLSHRVRRAVSWGIAAYWETRRVIAVAKRSLVGPRAR